MKELVEWYKFFGKMRLILELTHIQKDSFQQCTLWKVVFKGNRCLSNEKGS